MVKLRELLLAPLVFSGALYADQQKLEELVSNSDSSEYSISAPEQLIQQQNGYLDYVAAVDFLMKNDFEKDLNESGTKSRSISSYLKEIRDLTKRYARAIDLTKQGNRKQVYFDPQSLDLVDQQKFESYIFHLPRLLFYDAYQNFAAGNSFD